MKSAAPSSTRARLAAEIAEETGISRRDAESVVGMVFRSIAEALASGDEVEIRGFGSFRLRSRRARVTRNPRTGEPVIAPPRRVPFFRAGKKLREEIEEAAAAGAPPSPPPEPESRPEDPGP